MRIMDNFTKEQLDEIVKNNYNFKACLRILGYTNPSGDTVKAFKQKLKDLNISTEHFKNSIILKDNNQKIINPETELFIEDSPFQQSTLRKYYEKIFPQTRCSICNLLPQWNEKKLIFILDHINGKNHDNRLENLRWVCPNCNSQLSTTGSRNCNKTPIKDKKMNYCIDCGQAISLKSTRCLNCEQQWREKMDKANRPNRELLKILVRNKSFAEIGRDYNVSSKMVSKWCLKENLPHLKKDINMFSDDEWNAL